MSEFSTRLMPPDKKETVLKLMALLERDDMVSNATLKKWATGRLSESSLMAIVDRQYRMMTAAPAQP